MAAILEAGIFLVFEIYQDLLDIGISQKFRFLEYEIDLVKFNELGHFDTCCFESFKHWFLADYELFLMIYCIVL